MSKKLNHTLNELMVLGALMSSFSGSTLVLADSINQHMESFKKSAQNIKSFYKNKGQKIAINQQTKISQNNPWITINSAESQFLLLPVDNKTFVQYKSGQTTVVPDIITLNHNKKHLYYKIQLEKGTNQLKLIGQKNDPIKGLLFNNKNQFNSQVNLGRYEPNNLSQTDQRLVKKLSSQQQTTLIKGNLNFKFPKLPQSITASLTQPQTSTAENSQNTSKTDSAKNNSTKKTDDHKSKAVKKSTAATKKSTIKKQPTAIIKKKIVKKITAKVQKNSRSNSPKKNTSQSSKSTKTTTKAVIKKNKSVQSKTKTAVKRSQPAKVYSVKRSLLPDMAVSPFKVRTKSASPLMAALALPDATVTPSSGTYGTSKWSINSSGVLTIGAGTFPNNDGDSPWQSNSDITKIVITGKVILGNDASHLFDMDHNVQSIEGISNLDTSNVTNMHAMFAGDYGITSLDLSNFKTSKVKDMDSMFYRDFSLANLNVSSFDTSNVTNMNSMFNGDSSLTKLNVSSFDTSKVTDMSGMFRGDSALEKLDLSNWNTTKAPNESHMFNGLSSLGVLKLGPNIRFFKDSPSGLGSPSGQTNWQEVGADSGGTISNPQGKVYSPSDLNSLLTYTGITKDETFVPEHTTVDTDDQNISMPDRSNETNTLDLNTALNGKTFGFSSGSIYFEADKDDPGLSHQANKVVGLDSSDVQVSYNGQFVGDDAHDSATLASGSNQRIKFNLTNSGKAKLLANNTVKFYLVMTGDYLTYKIPVVLSEPISTWMPDTNLQQAAYNDLIQQGKSIDSISNMQKTDINQLNDLTNTGDNKIKDLTGLEYANILTSINLDGNDLGANQTNNEAIIAKLTTLESLNVSNNSLTGSLDPDWSNLKDLGRLQADNNSLSGNLPSSYSNLTNLIDLSAYNNQLSGTLTNDYFANMKGLRSVNLSNNQFTGQVPEFSYNDKLRSLNLNDNQLTGSLPDFSSSKQDLSSVLVSNNRLTGALPDNWSNLPAISYIDVSNNQLTGTLPDSWIANMPDLKSLCLNNNTGLAIPLADWTNWTKLEILDLDSDKLSGSLPTSWGTNKPDLMDVHLGSGKGITGSIPDSWGNLSNLTVLDIGDNQISGNVPDSFGKLTNLMSFRYGRNHITSSLKGTNSSGNYQTVKVDPSQWKREGDNLVLPYSAFYNGQTGSTDLPFELPIPKVLPYSAFYNGLTGSTDTQYRNMGWKKMDTSGAPYTLDNDKQEVVLNLKDYLKTWNAGQIVGIKFFIYDQNGSTAVNPTNMNYSSQIDAPVVLPTDFGSLNVNLSAHDSGANLKDGQFKIYDANGNEVTTDYNGHDIWESTTNSSSDYGALQIYLPDGNYTVVETKAPDGYELSKKSYQVTIRSGQSVDVNVINDKQTGLPFAGSSIMPWIISGLVEIALIGAGWYLSKRRRKPEK